MILPAAVPAEAGLRPCLVVGRLRMLLYPVDDSLWGDGVCLLRDWRPCPGILLVFWFPFGGRISLCIS